MGSPKHIRMRYLTGGNRQHAVVVANLSLTLRAADAALILQTVALPSAIPAVHHIKPTARMDPLFAEFQLYTAPPANHCGLHLFFSAVAAQEREEGFEPLIYSRSSVRGIECAPLAQPARLHRLPVPSCRLGGSLALSATQSPLFTAKGMDQRILRAVSAPHRIHGQDSRRLILYTARWFCPSLRAVTLPVSRHWLGCAGLPLSVVGATTPTGSPVQPGGTCTHRRIGDNPAALARLE